MKTAARARDHARAVVAREADEKMAFGREGRSSDFAGAKASSGGANEFGNLGGIGEPGGVARWGEAVRVDPVGVC